MKDNIKMIRNKALAFLLSEMAESTKDNGKMESNTEREFSKKTILLEKEYGMRVKGSNGWINKNKSKTLKANDSYF